MVLKVLLEKCRLKEQIPNTGFALGRLDLGYKKVDIDPNRCSFKSNQFKSTPKWYIYLKLHQFGKYVLKIHLFDQKLGFRISPPSLSNQSLK